jgi:hypothetical protein
VGEGVKVGVASARAVSVACANWALMVARKLTWLKGMGVSVGQTGNGVLVTMYPPPVWIVAASAVALKSMLSRGMRVRVAVAVGVNCTWLLPMGVPMPVVVQARLNVTASASATAASVMC